MPAGIEIEKYDFEKVQKRFLWNGSNKVQRVKMCKTEEKLKKKFMVYLINLKEFNQNNYPATLIMLSSIRFQMRRKEVTDDQAIQTGCINVIGDFGLGKSVTGKFLSK